MSDVFLHLPIEKQQRVIGSAMDIFAQHGYQKASVADIAKKAKISKAMIFTYFKSKKGCYQYVCNEMLRVSTQEFNKYKQELLSITDFFDRVIMSVKIKLAIFTQFPSLMEFATKMLSEKDEEVAPIIQQTIQNGYQLREMFLSVNVDSSKLKHPSDAQYIYKLTTWLSAGCADEWTRTNQNLNQIFLDFIQCIQLLKKNFCK